MKSDLLLEVARLGKTVGLKGGLKLHTLNDFPEIFCKGALFETKDVGQLEVASFDAKKNLIFFKDYSTPEIAKKLTNRVLLMSKEQTREHCQLKKDEFFWFDIENCEVFEDELLLGRVIEIERIADFDYLHVKSDTAMIERGLSKDFLIPYVDRYVQNVDIANKRICVSGGLELLESL